jgi:hypothetical protein
MRTLSEQFFPEKKMLKDTKRAIENINSLKFLQRGIVTKIHYDMKGGAPGYLPPYSIKVRVISEDIASLNPELDYGPWYFPLFPIHLLILPQEGEEVLLIREFARKNSQGYWIARINDSYNISRYPARSYSNDAPGMRYGFPFEAENLHST